MFKRDFPIFNTDLIYLDSAATAQKPSAVLDAMDYFSRHDYANVHRGTCDLASRATTAYENARKTVADFIGAVPQNIVFTKGTTEAINLVAGGMSLSLGDEVLVTQAEHHANFVPWQQACASVGATLRIVQIRDDGHVDMDDFKSKLSCATKMVAVTHLSNVVGVVNPVREMVQMAHDVGACVLIDAAQSVAHIPLNVADIGADFLVFSGHKLYGPTGIGVLYGTTKALESLPAYQFGGGMVDRVGLNQTTFAEPPYRFEAGTPPIVQAVGLAAAMNYIHNIGWDSVQKHEADVMKSLITGLGEIPGIQFLGQGSDKVGLVSIQLSQAHANDVAFVLAKENICVRVGHHCAMPIHDRFGVNSSLRISLGLYNNTDDVRAFLNAMHKALTFFTKV